MTVLSTLAPSDVFVGAQASTLKISDGMWHPCTIEKEILPSAEDEQQMLETGDFRCLQNKYVVRFPECDDSKKVEKDTVPLDYLRMSKEH